VLKLVLTAAATVARAGRHFGSGTAAPRSWPT